MLIDVRSHGFPTTDPLRRHVERLAELAFGWAAQRIAGVMVHLSDINGDHGGDDKACHVQVKLRHAKVLIARSVHHDMYIAIGQAVDKVKRAMLDEFGRRRSKQVRESLRHPRARHLPGAAPQISAEPGEQTSNRSKP